MQLNPQATYDCLFLGSHLQQRVGGFSPTELHLLSYLSCLLSLYRQIPVSDWGYSFVGTELGAPYSKEIDNAADELTERRFFVQKQNKLLLTESAEEHVRELSQLLFFKERTECLIAACASMSAFSIGMVSSAMSQEPELKRAIAVPSNRFLLEEPATTQLYEQFEVLRNALNKNLYDLRVPAVVWLEALYRAGTTAEA